VIEEDYRRWKDLPFAWIHRIYIVKMAILAKAIYIVKMATLPKAIYMFTSIPIKIPITLIIEIEKSTLKIIWKHKRLQIAKAILSKNSNAEGITIPNFKLFYRAVAIKTTW
jgi:hypothetical protein